MWQLFLVSLALSIIAFNPFVESKPRFDVPLKPHKTSADRIREHGYPAESHFMETSDGYVLNLFRIPFSPKLNNKNAQKPAVLLQHGLFSCSDCFLLNGPDNAIAYLLVDAGYDVWLGNARGNLYSRNNTKISRYHPNFYRFSWHEIAVIDMAESIDYILERTGEKNLHYIGHSQGGTVYFVLNSARPEYNEKIKTGHLLAPAVFMGNTTHPLINIFEPFTPYPGSKGERILEGMEFAPGNKYINRVLDTACGGNVALPKYCRTLFSIWSGPEGLNINRTLLPQIAETHPAGISTSQGIHYIQLKHSNRFRLYDHAKQNMKLYGQQEPPDYELGNIQAPTYVYYGLNDTSVNWRDIERLPDFMRNDSLKLMHLVPDETWGHIDFIFAQKVKETIYDMVLAYIDQYEANAKAGGV